MSYFGHTIMYIMTMFIFSLTPASFFEGVELVIAVTTRTQKPYIYYFILLY